MADEQPSSSASSSSSAAAPSSSLDTITSLSTPSSPTSPTASTSSSWHGLSSAANQPEAEQALDLANEAFAAGRYYKAERLCLRSIRLYETVAGNELLGRIYDKIPHARPGAAGAPTSSTHSTASSSSSSPPPSSAASSSSPSQSSSSASAPRASSTSSNASASSSSPPFNSLLWPSWLTIPPKHRCKLVVLWSLVLLVALLRYYGVISSLDTAFTPHRLRYPPTRPPHATPANGARTAGSSGSGGVGVGGSGSVGGWLLGLTNLFPLVLMLLFASGQWQRWLQHYQQQQRMQQQH